MQKMKEFEQEFNQLKNNHELTKERKTLLLSTLMTKLESEYKIPFLKSESDIFENENITNKKVMTLYREIANARQF